jgi:DNA mismatch repair protein MutS
VSTPIRNQYLELKRRYPDAILFFRLGDFYETFDDDARIVARELQIALTSKPMGKNLRVPLAGIPYQTLDQHVATLVGRGYRVAICEQLADPASVKGLVPRDVVRVVTAGTLTSEASLAPDAPNYLAAFVRQPALGAAVADVTTGDVQLIEGVHAPLELARLAPAELLVEDAADVPPGVAAPVRVRPPLSELAAEAELEHLLALPGRKALIPGPGAAKALAVLTAYLRETYPPALAALQRFRPIEGGSTLLLDDRTLRNLDVFPAGERRASLFAVLNATKTAMGARALRERLARPTRDRVLLEERLDAVAWAVAHPLERERARAALGRMPDLARLAGKVGARSAGPRDLHALREGLRAALDLGAALGEQELPTLLDRGRTILASAAEPLLAIDAVLAPDPPATFEEGGVIAPGVSPEVDSLRQLASDARGFILALEQRERERTGIRSLKVGYNKVFGYYLEVSAANAHVVPPDYQRRQTLVGAERYVTPELKEYESRLAGARDRLAELERQLFAQLVESVAASLRQLLEIASAVAEIDVALALGQVAADRGYVRPSFTEEPRLRIVAGRHPVVEAAMGPGAFVPNDCALGPSRQILVITGPNMSGKSTYLRQVALIALMAQAGSFVPAAEAELPLFDRIFTRIGAQDDLAAGQSTFMVEMVETAQILHQATPRSLVILDEVGRGTSTFDGMAIARAVVEYLHNRADAAALTLFATHYHELTALAEVLPRVANAHVAVREEGGEVVFEHRIVPGPSDRSYGVHVARLAGLPAAVVARAERLLDELQNGRGHVAAAPPLQLPLLAPEPSPIEAELAALDLDAMTPLEALQKLYELRARARERRA